MAYAAHALRGPRLARDGLCGGWNIDRRVVPIEDHCKKMAGDHAVVVAGRENDEVLALVEAEPVVETPGHV